MNSLAKLIPSIAALIASLSFAWIALSVTGTIPGHSVSIHHNAGLVLTNGVEYNGNSTEFYIGLMHH